MPFTVFISADGEIVEEHNGPLTEGQLMDMIEELLLDVADEGTFTAPGEVAPLASTPPAVDAAPKVSGPEVIIEADPDVPERLARLRD